MSSRFPSLVCLVLAGVISAGCRKAVTQPPDEKPADVRVSDAVPGPRQKIPSLTNPFAGDEAAIATGKDLYAAMNCAGCHASGGGAIGPALMDDEWIYGSAPENVYSSIVEGRPQGMPSFGVRIQEAQVWRLVAYVRSLSGLREAPKPESEPADDRGKRIFMTGPCAVCHTIRGTEALATVGPDLTGLATRKMIAGGTVPNTREQLAKWIRNPEALKPGTKMPATELSPADLAFLLTYLATLK